MSAFGWFGFRVVVRAPKGQSVHHAFKRGVVGERSLCGLATFGPAVRAKSRGCRPCGAKWSKKYPPQERTEPETVDLSRLFGMIR